MNKFSNLQLYKKMFKKNRRYDKNRLYSEHEKWYTVYTVQSLNKTQILHFGFDITYRNISLNEIKVHQLLMYAKSY